MVLERPFGQCPCGNSDLDWLSGACIAVPRKKLLDLGGWDESFFVYCDDVTLGRTIREAGLRERLRTELSRAAREDLRMPVHSVRRHSKEGRETKIHC